MGTGEASVFVFERFRLDVAERLLQDAGVPVQLPPKLFDTLRLLVENRGHVLTKERMLDEVWEGSFVEENNLAQNISQLRRLLGETPDKKFIETVPKFGYRFVAEVEPVRPAQGVEVTESVRARVYVDDGSSDSVDAPQSLSPAVSVIGGVTPETRYVQNGDVNIAYQVVGTGPIDIVFVMGWVSHLEYFWKHHLFASFLEKLASFSRLILFDKRGTGLSDRVPLAELPTLEQRMEDVHAVMDAVGSERAVLVGVSEGGPMCSLFAATYPERTAGLVMIGTYAKRIRDDDYPWAPTEQQREAFFDIMRREWGGPVGIEERAPSMADDPEFRDWWATYLRMGASPGAAVALTQMNAEIDVRGVLPSVRVPTLVIHRSGDTCLKADEGRFVAAQIPDAKYIELDGIDHLPFVGDQDSIVAEIEDFVASLDEGGLVDRVLATVLSISFGDSDPASGLSADIMRQVQIHKGRLIAGDGPGSLAAFDGPARAIRCAKQLRDAVVRLGNSAGIGLHTGECEVVGETFAGFAVNLAAKIGDLAEPGQIVVSRTVKDLVAGSGLEFTEIGRRSFPEIEGEWRLFSVT